MTTAKSEISYDPKTDKVILKLDNNQTLHVDPKNVVFEYEPITAEDPSYVLRQQMLDEATKKLFTECGIPRALFQGVNVTGLTPLYELGAPKHTYIPGPAVQVAIKMSNIENAPSQQTDATWTWKEPQIRCPNCGSIVNGLKSAQEVVPIGSPSNTAAGKGPKFNQKPVNTPTSGQVGAVRMVWRLDSCGCSVSPEWAGAYKAEVNNRMMGGQPKEVIEMTPEQREQKKKALEAKIAQLYALRDKYAQNSGFLGWNEGLKIEKDLVMAVDQLMRLCPGAHNKLPPISLSQGTLGWAAKNQLAIPPKDESAKIPDQQQIAEVLKEKNITTAAMMADAATNAIIGSQKANSKSAADYAAKVEGGFVANDPLLTDQNQQYAAAGYMKQPINPSQVLGQLMKPAPKAQAPQHPNPNIQLQTKPEGPQTAPVSTGLVSGVIQVHMDGIPNQPIQPGQPVKDHMGNIIGIAMTPLQGDVFEMNIQHPDATSILQQAYLASKHTGVQQLSKSEKAEFQSLDTPEQLLQAAEAIAQQMLQMATPTAQGNTLAVVKKENAILGALVQEKFNEAKQKLQGKGLPGAYFPTNAGGLHSQGPIVPPLNPMAAAKAQEDAQFALAKKIQQELVAHQATGAPLSPEAQQFLNEYAKIAGPVDIGPQSMKGPSTFVPSNPNGKAKDNPPAITTKESNTQFLDRLGRRRTRKLSRRKERSSEEELD